MPKVLHIVRLPRFFMIHLLLYAAGLLVLGRDFNAYIAILIEKKDNEEVYDHTMSFFICIFNVSNLIINNILPVCTTCLFCTAQSLTRAYVLIRGDFFELIT